MNWVNIWKPYLQFKFAEKIDKVPFFSRAISIFLDRIGYRQGDVFVNARCVCCGGFLGSIRCRNFYQWVCEPAKISTERCKYYGTTRSCEDNLECILKTNKELIERRAYGFKVIRSEILEVFNRYGVCIIDKQNKEVGKALRPIIKDFIVYAFKGRGRYALQEIKDDKVTHTIIPREAIYLIFYPTISLNLLEAKIKWLNIEPKLRKGLRKELFAIRASGLYE